MLSAACVTVGQGVSQNGASMMLDFSGYNLLATADLYLALRR